MTSNDISQPRIGPQIAAEGLRNQAAACRRLAAAAATSTGKSSIEALADHFDGEALKLDPSSRRR